MSMAWKKEKYGNLKINGMKMSDSMIKEMIEGIPVQSSTLKNSGIFLDELISFILLAGSFFM